MKKSVRNLLLMLGVLAVLGGAAAALLLTAPKEGEEPSSSSQVTESVVDKEPDQVASVQVTAPSGSWAFVPLDEPEDPSSQPDSSDASKEEESPQFTLKGREDNANTDKVTSSVSALFPMNAAKNLGTVEDYAPFGLTGEEAVTVSVVYTDGTQEEFTLGIEAPATNGRYVRKGDTVYIVPSLPEALWEGELAYFNTQVYQVPQQDKDVLSQVKISGKKLAEPVEIQYDQSSGEYLSLAPASGKCLVSDLLSALKSLTADSVAAIGASQDVLSQYGLDQPEAQVEFELNGETHTLKVSAKDEEDTRYLAEEGNDLVYRVSSSAVSAWAEASLQELRAKEIWAPELEQVKTLSLVADGDMAFRWEVEAAQPVESGEESALESAGEEESALAVKDAAGNEVEEDRYREIYKSLTGISYMSLEGADYSGTPLLEAEFTYKDGTAHKVEFYESGDRCTAVLNGEFSAQCRRSDLDKFLDVLTGEKA